MLPTHFRFHAGQNLFAVCNGQVVLCIPNEVDFTAETVVDTDGKLWDYRELFDTSEGAIASTTQPKN